MRIITVQVSEFCSVTGKLAIMVDIIIMTDIFVLNLSFLQADLTLIQTKLLMCYWTPLNATLIWKTSSFLC